MKRHTSGGRFGAAAALIVLAIVSVAHSAGVSLRVIPIDGPENEPVANVEQFSFHLDPFDPLSGHLVLPCGEPFPMPDGDFYTWIEGPNRVSQKNVAHGAAAEPVEPGVKDIAIKVNPAGIASVVYDHEATPGTVVARLLSVEGHRDSGTLHNEFARSVSLDVAQNGVLMPTGPVIAAIVDVKGPRYLAMTRPSPVRVGEVTKLQPVPPSRERAHLVVRLERPHATPRTSDDDVQVLATAPDSSELRPPTVLVPALGRVYALWYDLRPGTVTVEVRSPTVWTEDIVVGLTSGEIASEARTLQPRAALDLVLMLPSDLDGEQTEITLRSGDDVVAVRKVDPRFPAEIRIEGLPRLPLSVEAIVGPWKFGDRADLTRGDSRLVVAPEVARVSGRVTVGGDGVTADVEFLTNRSARGTEVASCSDTNHLGEFNAVLFPDQVQMMILVSIDEREPLWWMMDSFPVRDGDYLEIDIDGAPADAVIVDASTGSGVPDAVVSYGWEGDRGGGRQTRSDGDGRVRLPPVPAPRLDLFARAEGYEPSRLSVDMDQVEPEDEIVLPLEPEHEGDRIEVVLSDGAPASGADVVVLPDVSSAPRWLARADHEGLVAVDTVRSGELLAARHDRGGLTLFSAEEIPTGGTIRLAAPAGTLALRVEGPDGLPVPNAPVVAWLGGHRLVGSALAWLTDSAFATDRDGTWTAHYLPRVPIEVLAWRRTLDADDEQRMASGAFDYRRQVVEPPWPGYVVIEAVLP